MKNLSYKNDIAGSAVGAFCVLHCALTPLLFLSPNFIELGNHSSALFWWKNADFLFCVFIRPLFILYFSGGRIQNRRRHMHIVIYLVKLQRRRGGMVKKGQKLKKCRFSL